MDDVIDRIESLRARPLVVEATRRDDTVMITHFEVQYKGDGIGSAAVEDILDICREDSDVSTVKFRIGTDEGAAPERVKSFFEGLGFDDVSVSDDGYVCWATYSFDA